MIEVEAVVDMVVAVEEEEEEASPLQALLEAVAAIVARHNNKVVTLVEEVVIVEEEEVKEAEEEAEEVVATVVEAVVEEIQVRFPPFTALLVSLFVFPALYDELFVMSPHLAPSFPNSDCPFLCLSLTSDVAVLTSGQLLSNAVTVVFDPKFTWHRTGVDFEGAMSRRLRAQLFNAARSSLVKPGTLLYLPPISRSKSMLYDLSLTHSFCVPIELWSVMASPPPVLLDCMHVDTLLLFDGTNIYSLEPLPEDKRISVPLNKKTHEIRTVTSKRVGVEPDDCHALMNIIIRKVLESAGFKRAFDEFYDLEHPLRIDDERVAGVIDIFSGLVTEVSQRLINGRPSYTLSIDPTHKVVSKKSVLDMLTGQNQKDKANWIGVRVTTVYNFKSYGVEDINFNMTPNSTFKRTNRKTGEEEEISFAKYMAEVGVTVRELKQPLLVATGRQRERIFLLPEFCVRASVPGLAKAKLPQITSIKPTARVARVQSILRILSEVGQKKAAAALSQYGMQLGDQLIAVKYTVLQAPLIVFAPKKEIRPSGSEWRREASEIKYTHVTTKKTVQAVLVYSSQVVGSFAAEYWKSIKEKLKALGAPLQFEKDIIHAFDEKKYNRDYNQMLLDATTKLDPKHNPKDVLMVCFLTTDKRQDTFEYDAYRQFCLGRGYVGQGIDASGPSQDRKMDSKNYDSIVMNIARQVVNKFGFQSWWMSIPSITPKHANKHFLFIGIDVFHAPPSLVLGEKKEKSYWQKRSIAAYTAKLVIGNYTSHYCATEVRDAGAEISGQKTVDTHAAAEVSEPGASHLHERAHDEDRPLAKFVESAMAHWKQIKPSALVVIVYRDGVADSQMDQVDAQEVSQLTPVIPTDAHFIYSIVQKRVHNRFVMSNNGQYGNCAAGTVVEELARTDGRYNFFLVPCATNLSTNKPVHYTITHDSRPNTISNQEFHAITFAAHHCYQNWAGTVKVPDVCQYAHKLAYTLGESRIADPHVHPNLQDTMFYL